MTEAARRAYRLARIGRGYRYELRTGSETSEVVGSLRIRLVRSSEVEAHGERWLVKASPKISRVVARSAASGEEAARLEPVDGRWRLSSADDAALAWLRTPEGWALETAEGERRATSGHGQNAWYGLTVDYAVGPGWPSERRALLAVQLCTLGHAFLHGRAVAVEMQEL